MGEYILTEFRSDAARGGHIAFLRIGRQVAPVRVDDIDLIVLTTRQAVATYLTARLLVARWGLPQLALLGPATAS
jgi:hypothetical protein